MQYGGGVKNIHLAFIYKLYKEWGVYLSLKIRWGKATYNRHENLQTTVR